jgi:catalase-peroxidase
VATAWASASTFRQSDMRGGANGARIRLAPQKDWEVNEPAELSKALAALEKVQQSYSKQVSLADVIVLGGCAGVEAAAAAAGVDIAFPFTPGRMDTTQKKLTDVDSFAVLKPVGNGFRNDMHPGHGDTNPPAEHLLVDRAQRARNDSLGGWTACPGCWIIRQGCVHGQGGCLDQ